MSPFLVRPAVFLALLPLLLTAPRVSSNAATLLGHVTDATTGAPVAEAQVFIDGTGSGALSRADGTYLLSLPTTAVGTEVTVRVERIGFAAARRVIRIGDGANVADFALQAQALGLDEIVVSGTAGATRRPVDAKASNAPTPAVRQAAPLEPNREGYARIDENPFFAARVNPLSTFAIDVDRASYANVRRFIQERRRPVVDAVRIEELVNYFPYDYAGPTDGRPFAVHAEVSAAPWARTHRLVKIGVQGRRMSTEDMPPANLVFLVDVSGSMQPENKLPLLKQSLRLLVAQLRPEDRVALVVYAGAAGLVLPPTSGRDKASILSALDRLQAGGSTAGGAGLELAYEVARASYVKGGNNRVILATDGDFNVGASSDAEMVRLIEERRDQGTFLTVLGFGTGNVQDAKMEQIADHGNGNFAYIDDLAEARKVLVHEMGGTLLTIAKDVKIQVEFNPRKVAAYRLIGYENRRMAAEDFGDDRKDGGELGAGHTVTALYEVVLVGDEDSIELRTPVALRYQTPTRMSPRSTRDDLMFVELRYKQPDGEKSALIRHQVADEVTRPSEDFRFAAAVASFGMLLRGSPYAGTFGLDDVLRLARSGVGADLEGYRSGFVTLVEQARGLELLADSR